MTIVDQNRADHVQTADSRRTTRRRTVLRIALTAFFLWFSAAPGEAQSTPSPRAGKLVDRLLRELDARFKPHWLEDERAQKAIAEAKARAPKSRTLAEERALAFRILETIPVSHLGLLSTYGKDVLEGELAAEPRLTLGFQLVNRDGAYFVDDVMDGGAADRAGLKRGDQVLAIDGNPCAKSPRLDYRTDDAALADPPRHLVRVDDETPVRIRAAHSPEDSADLVLTPIRDSAAAADRRAAGAYDVGKKTFGYVSLHFMYYVEAAAIVDDALKGPLATVDGLILDLRGRGGSGDAALKLASWFRGKRARWTKPLVVLIDRRTRSAKEMLAHDLKGAANIRLVGEKTAGAVRPCTFVDIGRNTVLMTPLGGGIDPVYTEDIELKGVEPDVVEADAGPFSAGADPILERGLRTLAEMTRSRGSKKL